ncbi:RNA-binding protein 26 [Lingula anatina]|uniref:RNA-binding protein 26 n=1 Tax=Lingula anatina TaxID=7574 RepID=A0A1S3HEL2_LINAN|nr:RNA-binding protein 26 [Lingula anatina]|eukprot:XP_013384517.1 RNA-binding protein 26 [Lingula anatina]
MLIENVDALKAWLTKTLTPICDADPEALAKYIVALVKKDKTLEELRELCNDQLEVFLQKETKSFVESLFVSLDNKSYQHVDSGVAKGHQAQQSQPPTSQHSAPGNTEKRRKSDELPDKEDRDHRRTRSRSPRRGNDRDRDDRRRRYDDFARRDFDRHSRGENRGPRYSPDSRGSTPTQDNHRDQDYPPPGIDVNANHAFDSWRGRERDSYSGRPPRGRGGPSRGRGGRHMDRGGPPRRPRCRDYDEKGFCMRGDLCPFDHGADPVVVEDVALPGVLAFPGGPQAHPPAPPMMPGNQPPRLPPGPPPSQQPPPLPAAGPTPANMRLPHPQHDRPPMPPGGPPLPPRNEPYEPEPYKPTEGRPGQQPWGGGPRGPKPQQYQPQQRVPNPNLVSVPTVGSMEDKGLPGQQQHHPPQQQQQQQQQLQQLQHSPNRRVVASKRGLEVPPYQEQIPPQQPNQYSNPEQQFHRGPPAKRGHFDFNRLGPRRGGGRGAYNTSSENATLEVRKIPRELNNIAKINEHFSKFGTIVNLQVCYGGDPEAALVSFASHHQANSAYRSSEPVFNNRFVKVFWHKEQQQQQSQQGPAQQGAEAQPPSVKDRLGYHSAHKVDNTVDNSEKGFVHSTTGGSLTKTVFNPAAVKGNKSNSAEKAAQIIKSQEALKKTEEAKKDVIKKRLEIQKQKQTLLQKQLEQQKLLIQKLDKNKGTSPEEKAVIVKTIKTLAASIDKLKLEITASPNVGGTTGGGGVEFHHKSKQEAQKELLDTELELMTKETSGGDTSDLKKKIMELKREAAALGIVEARRGRGRGRGGAAPRGRGRGRGRGGVTMAARSVDRRPRQLLVRGFSLNEKDEVISQFQNYGEIEKIDCDESEPNVILTFKTRQEAETMGQLS